MKTAIAYLIVVSALVGCSKNEPRASSQSASRSATPRPPISFISGSESKEAKEIQAQAITLLTNRDFARLEALAAGYRASKEQNSHGFWKLAGVYNALEPGEEDAEALWLVRIQQIQEWTRARPETAMPRIALGRVLTSYAWKARGGDWADKVKDKDWQTFFARLQKASLALQEAKRLKEPCPVYWSSLQQVALGLQFNKPRYNAIFAQAIQEYPDYQYYYSARSIYLLPRWYGEEGEWEKELTRSADRIGGPQGDVLYARVVWWMSSDASSEVGALFKRDPSAWERVDRGFEQILKDFPDSLAAKTRRALLAAVGGHRDKARSYFLQTNGEVDLAYWAGQKDFEKFFNWTFGL